MFDDNGDDGDGREIHVLSGMVAGAVAGLFAGWAMTRLQEMFARQDERRAHREAGHATSGSHAETADSPTVKTARAVADRLGHELSAEEEANAGPMVHYLFSALMGAFYGGACELVPFLSAGMGTLFGTALWIAADEVALPAFGLAKPPLAYPPRVHGRALAAHMLWGVTTDVGRRILMLGR